MRFFGSKFNVFLAQMIDHFSLSIDQVLWFKAVEEVKIYLIIILLFTNLIFRKSLDYNTDILDPLQKESNSLVHFIVSSAISESSWTKKSSPILSSNYFFITELMNNKLQGLKNFRVSEAYCQRKIRNPWYYQHVCLIRRVLLFAAHAIANADQFGRLGNLANL